MSNLEASPREARCGGRTAVAADAARELLPASAVPLGGPRAMQVSRSLPGRHRRMVGSWCFLDHYGPEDLTTSPGMRLPPHPHTGLQTVSWLLAGEVLHRDSLGNTQLVRPGQLNLMTAGRAIAHSEETPTQHAPAQHSPVLHGLQLWTALPDRDRNVEPHFEHHPQLPVRTSAAGTVTVFMGELAGAASPARTYAPLVGAEVVLVSGGELRLPLRDDFEHATLALSGSAEVDGAPLAPGPLLYLGPGRTELALRASQGRTELALRASQGRTELALRASGPARLLLLGGEPFDEQIVMWWNFIGRDHDEIVAARADWMAGRRFGPVPGYAGEPLPAPPMPTSLLKPRGRQR